MYEESVVWRGCLYDSSTSIEDGVYVMTVSCDENVCMKIVFTGRRCLHDDSEYMMTAGRQFRMTRVFALRQRLHDDRIYVTILHVYMTTARVDMTIVFI